MLNKKYLYVITRKDLTPSQIAVQSIHAAFEMGRNFCLKENHPSVVLIKAANEDELYKVKHFLSNSGLNFKTFIEPYYNNSLTSIAVEPVCEDQRTIFKKFKLFRNKDFQEVNL